MQGCIARREGEGGGAPRLAACSFLLFVHTRQKPRSLEVVPQSIACIETWQAISYNGAGGVRDNVAFFQVQKSFEASRCLSRRAIPIL